MAKKKLVALLDKLNEQTTRFGRGWCRSRIAVEKYQLVDTLWRLKLLRCNRNAHNRIRIGFGPILERENTLGFRKWGIDPIVDTINGNSARYVADIFFGDEDLSRFDIVVIVKNFDHIALESIKRLKRHGTILIYNPRDNPAGCVKDYHDHDAFTDSINGFILSSPIQKQEFDNKDLNNKQIGTPIINRRFKKTYRDKGTLKLVWQGYLTNAVYMKRLHPIIRAINRESSVHLSLVYHCDRPPEDVDGHMVLFTRWRRSNWQKMLVRSDIGVIIKPIENEAQQQKPPTKVISYMAAGLPVVCTPSAADKLVIEHGRTGFFAYSDDDWHGYLTLLSKDRHLREKIGKAAREYIYDAFNVERVTRDYLAYLDSFQSELTWGRARIV